MRFKRLFESALKDFLRKHYGGSDLKKATQDFKNTIQRADVKQSINRVKASFAAMSNSYVSLCKKYPHLDIACQSEWDKRLTDEEKIEFEIVRQFIDKERAKNNKEE